MATSHETLSTKERIIEGASELFALKGYDGASVRDIATHCDCNVSAVNYHFKNKENLSWEIYARAYEWFEAGGKQLAEQSQSTEDLARRLFEFLLSDRQHVKNTFKLLISDAIGKPGEDRFLVYFEGDKAGPPNGEVLGQFLMKDTGVSDPRLVIWAARAILAPMFHWAIMLGTDKFNRFCKAAPFAEEDHIREDLQMTTRAIVHYLKSQKN